MKVFIISAAILIVFISFFIFQTDHDQFKQMQEQVKATANNCADAAALYYDEDAYSEGYKVFNKVEGNQAVLNILKENLQLNGSMGFHQAALKDDCRYNVIYFDETGRQTTYRNGSIVAEKEISYPFQFVETESGYQKMIEEATVIVTIDAGKYNYKLPFINDPRLIRTSGYEHRES